MALPTSFPKSEIKIVLAENIHPSADEIFEREGYKVERLSSSLSREDLRDRLQDAHVLGIRSKSHLPAEYFQAAKRLLSVGCFCIGYNQVDLQAAKVAGVPVFNAPFSNTRSVAEMVIAEMVMLSRQLGDRNSELHRGEWRKTAKSCFELREKTLGIVGYGHIGSQVSVLAEALGLQVRYFDIASKMPIGNSHPVESMEELLQMSDFVTLHVPETPQTKDLISEKEIRLMKPGSFLLNLSRGTVVDLKALAQAIRDQHLGGAAIDVFPEEPASNEDRFEHELQGLKNVILTPHIGGSTEEAQYKIGQEVATSLVRFLDKGSTAGSVNFPQVDLPAQDRAHRILNVHKNVPGVLGKINGMISEIGANIKAQYLSTDPDIGYLIIDLDQDLSDRVKQELAALETSIKTRILY